MTESAKKSKEWRKKNPDKVNAYYKMRYKRDVVKIRKRRKEENNQMRYGGNREVVLERDNWECQECGMNQEQHIVLFGRSLTIHHIDGKGWNSETPNHNLNNLITLCLRCHARLENFIRSKRKEVRT